MSTSNSDDSLHNFSLSLYFLSLRFSLSLSVKHAGPRGSPSNWFHSRGDRLSLGPDRFHQVLKLESPGYSLPTNQSSSQACRRRWLDNTFSSDNYADEAVSYDNAADYPDLSLLLRLLGYVPFPLNGGEAGALTNPRTVKSRRETPEEMKNVRVRWRDRGAESCFLHSRGNGTFSCRPTENVYGCGNDLGVDPR